jgi:hypothetical protein
MSAQEVQWCTQLQEHHLRRGMKRGALGSGATLQQLDALLPLLARALASRHAAAASLALRCLCHAVRLPLPGALLLGAVRACVGSFVSRAMLLLGPRRCCTAPAVLFG